MEEGKGDKRITLEDKCVSSLANLKGWERLLDLQDKDGCPLGERIRRLVYAHLDSLP